MVGVLIKIENLNTDIHMRLPCEDEGRFWIDAEVAGQPPKLEDT
jgi:hypothetical protein